MTELIVDSFAGGGGASLGIEWATGRSPDIAINHDAEALAMHAANHPDTLHLSKNIWKVDPTDYVNGHTVGLAWFSPDCKHFSKAKGGRPVKRNIRDLAWVVVLWAKRVRPRVICLENVEEYQDWGPVDLDGRPCGARRGETFRKWVGELERLGYVVEWRILRACDYGAPTIRKRLLLIARCDGEPIVWPDPTHGSPHNPEVISGKLKPWRTAAEIIDWSLPCHSIFLSKDEGRALGVKRPLAENTMARIAKGVVRYVLDAADPFIVTCNHGGDWFRGQDLNQPVNTVTAARDAHGLVTPFVTKFRNGSTGHRADEPLHTVTASSFVKRPAGSAPLGLVAPVIERQFGNSAGNAADAPLGATTAGGGGKSALVAAFLAQHNTGVTGHDAREAVSTIVQKGSTQAVVASHMINLKGSDRRDAPTDRPMQTQTSGGRHIGEVRAFLMKYYGSGGQWQDCRDPVHTVRSKAGLGIVTVEDIDYQIVDIGMRMLSARELFRAQGFPDSYIIDPEFNGKPLTKTVQIRCCGNSVPPQWAEAIVRANFCDEAARAVA